MASTNQKVCSLGTSLREECHVQPSDNYHDPNDDEKEILCLRCNLPADEPVTFVCNHHWDKYMRLYSCNEKQCLDPFGHHGQRAIKKGLREVTLDLARLHRGLRLIPGRKLCPTCRREVSKHNDTTLCESDPESENGSQGDSTTVVDESAPTPTASSTSMIENVVLPTINKAFDVIGETPLNPKRMKLHGYGKRKLDQLQAGVQGAFQMHPEQDDYEMIVHQLKEKFPHVTRSEKIQILTLLPRSWSIKRIEKEFNVTNWMARTAKKLQKDQGVMSSPNAKLGRRLGDEVIQAIREYYLSDSVSRVMPGKKDCKSIYFEKEGRRKLVQKRLVLCNLKEAYAHFKSEFPGTNVGFSKFAEFRPKECVLAGASGTHTVCVCTIHQNSKLMLSAVGENSYQNLLAEMSCNPGKPECFLGECQFCPGVDGVKERLLAELEEKCIETVTYKQWVSTDRCDLVTMESDIDDFCDLLFEKLKILRIHDFIAKQQADYLVKLKKQLGDDEVIVLSDYSENYAFIIQDAAQGYHWTNQQATLHPSVVYYKENGITQSISCVMISDRLTHDTVGVSFFHKELMQIIKSKIVPKRVFYFSDGSAAQYKNRKNFANLSCHEEDYGMPAEWHFFATAHGKGPCDGIGGTLKRLATRASLQRPLDSQIQTPHQLFEWAKDNLAGIVTVFCSDTDIAEHETKLKPRLDNAITVSGTQKLHAFCSVDEPNKLLVKRYSNSSENRKVKVLKTYQ